MLAILTHHLAFAFWGLEPPETALYGCLKGCCTSICNMGHDVSNMRGFDSYRLLTLSLAALMTRISSAMIEGAHTSAVAATLARTVPFWVRFRSPREPTAPFSGAVPRVPTAECHKHCAVPPSPTGCLVCWLGCPNATILALATSNPRAVWVVLTSTDAR